jgi:hypothetical protein
MTNTETDEPFAAFHTLTAVIAENVTRAAERLRPALEALGAALAQGPGPRRRTTKAQRRSAKARLALARRADPKAPKIGVAVCARNLHRLADGGIVTAPHHMVSGRTTPCTTRSYRT